MKHGEVRCMMNSAGYNCGNPMGGELTPITLVNVTSYQVRVVMNGILNKSELGWFTVTKIDQIGRH